MTEPLARHGGENILDDIEIKVSIDVLHKKSWSEQEILAKVTHHEGGRYELEDLRGVADGLCRAAMAVLADRLRAYDRLARARAVCESSPGGSSS